MTAPLPHATRFITGKNAVLAELVATAATAREHVGVEAFRMRGGFVAELADAIGPDVTVDLLVSSSSAARSEGKGLARRLRGDVGVTHYDEVVRGLDAFNHAKSVNADGQRLTVSTAAMSSDTLERLDWGITVGGATARAAAEVMQATRAGDPGSLLARMRSADDVGLHYNDVVTQARFATDAWLGAIRSVRPGDELWIATKKISSVEAARELAEVAKTGADVHVVAARATRKAKGVLRDSAVDFRMTPWPGISLHGNLTVTREQLLLGTAYLAKRSLGASRSEGTRELLIGSREAAILEQGLRAVQGITSHPVR